jgi:DNA topoisomerase I
VFDSPIDQQSADPQDAARLVGLRYVSDQKPGIRRRKAGRGFVYLSPAGAVINDQQTIARIRTIVIPPAWTDVWISPHPNGHIQAAGRDARGRKQYRYHARFREIRENTKYEHVMMFARTLPALRATVRKHMALRGLPRKKVIATVVHLLETTLIRVGNDDYARHNESYGLTTLKNRHVAVEGAELRFRFTGKGGKQWAVAIRDRRVAKIVKACQDLPGQELLQYIDEDGEPRDVTSADVNDYLHEISGESITAKDFRTWAGTVLAAITLHEFERYDSAVKAKKNIRAAIERVASRLGNTPTICRKCYIHPAVLNCYLEGKLRLRVKAQAEQELRTKLTGLSPEEAAVLATLHTRLTQSAGTEKQSP